MKTFSVVSVLLLTLVLASPSAFEAQVRLQPSELCSDHSDAAIATFEDANLGARVRAALSVGAQQDLTCGLVSGLTGLRASSANSANIVSLVGIQNLTSLADLDLWDNSITDISALSGLTSLTDLNLNINSITDIGPLIGLTSLTILYVSGNPITDIGPLSGLTNLVMLRIDELPGLTDIQPLLNNTGLGTGDAVILRNTNVSCTDVAALRAKGVGLDSDCP